MPKRLTISDNDVINESGGGEIRGHFDSIDTGRVTINNEFSAFRNRVGHMARNTVGPYTGNLITEDTPPLLCIWFDDSPEEDLTLAKPALEDKGAVGNFAIPVKEDGSIGAFNTEQNNGPTMDAAGVRELAAAGHEIAGHGLEAAQVGAINLASDASAGATSITVTSGEGDDVLLDRPYQLRRDNGTQEEVVFVSRSGDTLTLESSLSNSYTTADDAKIRMTQEAYYDYFWLTRKYLEQAGVPVRNFVYPKGNTGGTAGRRATSMFFDAGRGTDGTSASANERPINLFQDGGPEFTDDRMTSTELETYLDDIANNNRLGMLYSHCWDADLTESRIKEVIDKARSRGIRIVTYTEALAYYGYDIHTEPFKAWHDHSDVPRASFDVNEIDFNGIGGGLKNLGNNASSTTNLLFNGSLGTYFALGDGQDWRVYDGANSVYRVLTNQARLETELPRMKMPVRSSAPSSPEAGDFYIDDGTNTSSGNVAMRVYDGAAWVDQN